MRLTKLHREAFVRAAINDVPTIDYRAQAQKLVQDFQLRRMPKEVRAVYDKAELRGFLRHNSYAATFGNGYIAVYGDAKLDDATNKKLDELRELNDQQRLRINALKTKLEGVLLAVTTRKALVEALPEFEKYAPAEAEPTSRSVPALANLVSDFMAAGWPKDKPKPAAKRARKTAAK